MATLTQSQRYRHYPLDLTASKQCIRLRDLLPDQRDGLVRCAMLPEKQVFLVGDTHRSYVAISYECGDQDSAEHIILINDKIYSIRHNLYTLLVSLQGRHPDGMQNLWVDAISIDQINLAEKIHQVQLMESIYKKAHHVLCWLGPAGDGSDMVFDLLNDAGIPVQHELSAADSLRSISRADFINLHDTLLEAGERTKSGFVALTKRRYWSKSSHSTTSSLVYIDAEDCEQRINADALLSWMA